MQGVTSLAQQVAPMAQAAPVKKEPLYKTYGEYFKGNPEAQRWSHYNTKAMPGTEHGNQLANLNFVGANPYKFAMEYNQYTAGLPREYELLARSGLDPSRVESGEAKRIWDPRAGKMLDIPLRGETSEQTTGRIGGTGSSFSLTPDILSKMWR